MSIILAQDLMGPQHFLVGQLVSLLQVFVSLKIRPAPCGRRPRVSRWLCVTRAALIPRAQPRSLSCSGQWGLGGSAPDAYRKCFCTDTPAWEGLGRPHGGSGDAGPGVVRLAKALLPWTLFSCLGRPGVGGLYQAGTDSSEPRSLPLAICDLSKDALNSHGKSATACFRAGVHPGPKWI